MLSKFKPIMTSLSSNVKRNFVPRVRFYTPDTDSRSLQIHSLRHRLEKVTKSLSVYDKKIVIARQNTDLERKKDEEFPFASIKYLTVHSLYLGKLYDEQTLINSYEKLLNEKKQIFTDLCDLDAMDQYLHVTRDLL